MLKKVTKLLLAFTLVLQILSSYMVVASANERNVLINVLNDPTNPSDEDDQDSLELEEDNGSENVESTEAEQDGETADDEYVEDDEDIEGDEDVEGDEVELETSEEVNEEAIRRIPQASIDAMRTLIEENSEDNPFIIPSGLSFIEAINALDWGEDVSVSPVLTGYDILHGAIALILSSEIDEDSEHTYDDEHWFFEVAVFVQYDGDEEDDEDGSISTIPQTSIDMMREFIENNSADNPFIIPAGLNFTEAINALDLDEGVTVLPIMSSHGLESGSVRGSLFLRLNHQVIDDEDIYDDEYGFLDIVIYYENVEEAEEVEEEEPSSEPPPPPPAQPAPEQPPVRVLPQTGTDMLNMSLIGGGILAVGGLLIYLKNRNKK